MFKTLWSVGIAAFWITTAYARDAPSVLTVMPSTEQTVTVDGKIEPGEYPTTFRAAGKGEGFEASFAVHGDLFFVALKTPHTGWEAAGFGSDHMSGGHLVIGYMDGQGKARLEEDDGSWFFHRHGEAKTRMVDAWAMEAEDGGRVLEFSVPVRHVEQGASVNGWPVLLAFREKSEGISGKHTFKTRVYVRLKDLPTR